MAKKYSGEIKVKAGDDDITLRLTSGAAQELEGYFDQSLIIIAHERLVGARTKFSDVFAIYAAMTGRNISSKSDRDAAAEEISSKVGLPRAIKAIHACLLASIGPGEDVQIDHEEEAPIQGKFWAALKATAMRAAKMIRIAHR